MKKLIFCLQIILIASVTFANATDLFTPDPYILEAHDKGESLSDEEFMYYAFVLSEIPTSKIPAYMQEYKELAQELENELSSLSLTPFETGDYILHFLHDNQFKTYREPITNLNNLFDSGAYNCVSSSILYYALAERLGLSVTGVKTFDHAFCSVIINSEVVDVETTSPYGFNPGEKKEFENSFGQTGFVYTPPSNYRDRTNIGKKSLLSLILQNRIVELYKTERFDTIVGVAANINALLQTQGSFDAMINEFANYAAYLSKRKRFSDGIVFFSNATAHYGSHPKFEELAGSLFNNAIATYLSYRSIHQLKQNLSSAQTFFSTFQDTPVIPDSIIQSSQKILDEATIRVYIEDNNFSNSILEIKNYFTENRITQSLYYDLLMYQYSKEINIRMTEERWEDALTLAKEALVETRNDYRAKSQLQAVEHNIGVFFHNKFATQFNQQNFTEAKKIINEGLSIIPTNKTLLSDDKRFDAIK